MIVEGIIVNVVFSQNLFNIQVVGFVIVEDGKLVLDVIFVVDFDIFGFEKVGV